MPDDWKKKHQRTLGIIEKEETECRWCKEVEPVNKMGMCSKCEALCRELNNV